MSGLTELRKLQKETGELVAKHARARQARDFTKYADDPEGFFVDVLHWTPWSRQLEMVQSIRDNPRTVAVSGNSIGKDALTAVAALWWVYARRGFVILTGPGERQVKTILFREIKKAFARAPSLPGELYTLELRTDDAECGILGFTSDAADRLSGYHHPRLLIAITEAQGVDDEAFEAALSCATATGNRIFAYGNPLRRTGSFARFAGIREDARTRVDLSTVGAWKATTGAEKRPTWNVITIPSTEHPNVIEGREVIPGGATQEWIDAIAEEYGRDSIYFKSHILAQFPQDGTIDALIKAAWYRAAVDRWKFETESPDPNDARYNEWRSARERRLAAPPVVSVDVARYGADDSALAVIRGGYVDELVTWRDASITETIAKVEETCARVRASDIYNRRPTICVDVIGVGAGVADGLRAKGWDVLDFNASEQSSDPARWLNKRAEAFWWFRCQLEAGKLALPPDELLREEAIAIEWTTHPGRGCIQIGAKDLVRKTIGRSPDRLDAVVMGLAVSLGALQHDTIYAYTAEDI